MLTCAIKHCDDVIVFFRYGSDTFVGRKPSNEDRVVEDEDLGVMGRYFAVYGKAPFSQLFSLGDPDGVVPLLPPVTGSVVPPPSISLLPGVGKQVKL